MILHPIEQRSEAWYSVRAGKITGTRFAQMMMKHSTQGYKDLITDLAAESITETQDAGGYVSEDMQRGIDLEPMAVKAYKDELNKKGIDVGFIEPNEDHEFFGWIGISPDHLIIDDNIVYIDDNDNEIIEYEGLLEVKCPKLKTHFNYICDDRLPNKYKYQVQAQLYVTSLDYVDFMSFYPSQKIKPFIIRVKKDPIIHESFEAQLRHLIPLVKEKIEIYKNYNHLV